MKKSAWLLNGLVLLLIVSCKGPSGEDRQEPALFLSGDLQATLWAESPQFYNPTNMDVDARGRIWITEAVNYRNFNNDSSKAFHHPKGDRVMILEDTNHDGKADVSKVFVEDRDLIAPLGIAVIGHRVYVSCSPNLIVYTDDNGDDIPDHKEILLTGFGGKDHDHSLHAVTGGPDGLLHFIVGNAGPHIVTDKSGWTLRAGSLYTGGSPYNRVNEGNLKSDDGKVWVGGLALRVDNEGKGLKVMGHNFRNSYELATDSRGDMWQNDNDDQVLTCRTTWLMEGGNAGYFSADGTRFWQADQRPGQSIFTAHWHQDDPGVMPAGDNSGAGSPTGVVLNEGDALGEKYRGMLLSADAGRNVIFAYHPKKSGSGYDLGARTNFISSRREDNVDYVWSDSAANQQEASWFRPSDVAIGTDGAIYVADWYDPVVGGHQMKDTIGYGRIYRITPRDKKMEPPHIDLSTVQGQIEALKNPAVNVRYEAFLKLKEQGESVIGEVKQLLQSENPYHRARAVWLLSQLGPRGKAEVEGLLDNSDENIRTVAFRALRQVSDNILPYAEKLASDPSPFVRREVAIALEYAPYKEARPVFIQLIKNFDGEDRWYLEALGKSLSGHEEDIYKEAYRMFNAGSVQPAQWDKRFSALAWRLHPPSSVNDLKKWATAEDISDAERSRALTALAFIHTSAAAKTMLALKSSPLKTVADQAVYWLSFRYGNDWYALLDWKNIQMDPVYERKLTEMNVLKSKILDERLPFDEKKWNSMTMAGDSVGGQILLGMLSENTLPRTLFPFVEKEIFKNPNQAVRIQASAYFKRPGDTTVFSIHDIAGMSRDVASGEKVFTQTCSVCHRVNNTGKDIGPELTHIGKKFGDEELLDAIVNPSGGIVFGYEPWVINTKKGESFFGFLVADGKETVVIKDLAGNKHVIPAKEISSREKQKTSLMPEPSALGLSKQNLSDVAAYLESLN